MKQYILFIAVVVYLIIMALLIYARPRFMFQPSGIYKEFGAGVSNRTVFPIWLFAVIAAPISYLIAIKANKYYNF